MVPSPRSRSSSISSSDEAVVREELQPRSVATGGGVHSSAAESNNLQHNAQPSIDPGSVGPAAAGPAPSQLLSAWALSYSSAMRSRGGATAAEGSMSAAAAAAAAAGVSTSAMRSREGTTAAGSTSAAAAAAAAAGVSTTAATRLGRVIKKPVRLEHEKPGRQTLAGRNGRADAPAKVAARAAAAAAVAATAAAAAAAAGAVAATSATNTVTGDSAAGLSCANGKADSHASDANVTAGETTAMGKGAKRCVARLGTAAGSEGVVGPGDKSVLPSARNGSVAMSNASGTASDASSSPAEGSVARMALPADVRTAGLPLRGRDADETAGDGGGDSSRKSRDSVKERDRMVVPDPPPKRPVGGLGPMHEDTIKEYKRAFDDVRKGFSQHFPRMLEYCLERDFDSYEHKAEIVDLWSPR